MRSEGWEIGRDIEGGSREILEKIREQVELRGRLEGLRKEKAGLESMVKEVEQRAGSIRLELFRVASEGKRLEESILRWVWQLHWADEGNRMRMGYVSGEERARLSLEELRELNRQRQKRASKKRYKGRSETKLSKAYRHRAQKVLGNSPLKKSCESLAVLVGCSVAYWRSHLEGMFEDGMDWDNYGRKWDVDHIMPVSSFDLKSLEGAKRAFNWANTRPTWKWENSVKGARITEPQYQLALEIGVRNGNGEG